MKKVIVLLVSALLLLCGCRAGDQSDASVVQAYYDELAESYFEYVSGSSLSMAPEAVKANVKARTSGLARFDKLTPPPEYAERHAEMMRAADKEREWNKQLSAYANGALSYEDLRREQTRIYGDGRLIESGFTTKILEISADLYNDPRTTANEDEEKLWNLSRLFQ